MQSRSDIRMLSFVIASMTSPHYRSPPHPPHTLLASSFPASSAKLVSLATADASAAFVPVSPGPDEPDGVEPMTGLEVTLASSAFNAIALGIPRNALINTAARKADHDRTSRTHLLRSASALVAAPPAPPAPAAPAVPLPGPGNIAYAPGELSHACTTRNLTARLKTRLPTLPMYGLRERSMSGYLSVRPVGRRLDTRALTGQEGGTSR